MQGPKRDKTIFQGGNMKIEWEASPIHCDRCEGTGRTKWSYDARPDETDECTVCEGHGEHYYDYSHIEDKLINKAKIGDR